MGCQRKQLASANAPNATGKIQQGVDVQGAAEEPSKDSAAATTVAVVEVPVAARDGHPWLQAALTREATLDQSSFSPKVAQNLAASAIVAVAIGAT